MASARGWRWWGVFGAVAFAAASACSEDDPPSGGDAAPDAAAEVARPADAGGDSGAFTDSREAGVHTDAALPSAGPDGLVDGGDAAIPDVPAALPDKLDLIFVIDNSNSMAQEQDNLARNFPTLMNALTRAAGGALDMHIGIVSSNVGAGRTDIGESCRRGGDRGEFQVRPECGLDPSRDGKFLRIDKAGKTNFDGAGGLNQLPTMFACLARLGTAGCGYEHQLLSLYFAIDGITNPVNRGFLRDDAALGIVILSDEDDCSAAPDADFFADAILGQAGSFRCAAKGHVCDAKEVAPVAMTTPLSHCQPFVVPATDPIPSRLINVSTFVNLIKGLKRGDTSRIAVATIMGWSNEPGATYRVAEFPSPSGGAPAVDLAPICESPQTGSAAPGIRLHAFAQAFPRHSVHAICAADLSPAMTAIGQLLGGMARP